MKNDPVQVRKGMIQVGSRRIKSEKLACLFIRPRTDSETACVGVVGGTGIEGMRLTNTRHYLYAGYALPDLTIFSHEIREGDEKGLVGAGFFGNDWDIETGVFEWRE